MVRAPYIHGDTDILKMRAESIYQIDAGKKLRNPRESRSYFFI